MQDRPLSIVAASAVMFLVVSHPVSAAEPAAKRTYQERHMGVDVNLTLYEAQEAVANDAAAKAFARIAELNAIFSDYDPQSEAMRLCRSGTPGQPIAVSPDLWTVLETAESLSRRSDGAFDVTIGPITKLWRRSRRRYELPDPMTLREARDRVGWKLVSLIRDNRTVTLQRADMQLDFGGIVKGYAAEAALKVLKEQGIPRSLVAVAGDIAAGDPPRDQPGWRIGIAPLDHPDGPPSMWLKLANASVSTSGDAFQYVELDGVRYSHIVDPHTGLGLTHRCSVTVISTSGMLADAVATTASILGPEAGKRFIEETPAAGVIIFFEEGNSVTVRTRGLEAWVWEDE